MDLLTIKDIPLDVDKIHIYQFWHIKHTSDAGHQWLRILIKVENVGPDLARL